MVLFTDKTHSPGNRPPMWFQLLRCCTGVMRLLALATAAYFVPWSREKQRTSGHLVSFFTGEKTKALGFLWEKKPAHLNL